MLMKCVEYAAYLEHWQLKHVARLLNIVIGNTKQYMFKDKPD